MGRILYLSKGGAIGGSQRQLYYLATNLGGAYEPVVICTGAGETVAQLRSSGIPTEVLPLRPWRKLASGLGRYVDARRLVAVVRRYDPVLVHSSDMWLGNYVAWLKRRLGIPTIIHVRTPLEFRDIEKHRLRLATGLISISPRITHALAEARIAAERIVQIEDGVDIEAFRPRQRSPHRLTGPNSGDEVISIGIVGRIEPAKRQLEFVEAAARVTAELPGRARFLVIGEVRYQHYLGQLKRVAQTSGLNGQLVFTGRKDNMPDVLSSLDVLVSLSGGSVMYEAMSCGVCVLSAGFTNLEDSLHVRDGVTGVVVPVHDASALAGALVDLVQHPERRRWLGQAGRAHAETRLSHVTMAARTRCFYEELLSGQRHRQGWAGDGD